MCKKRSKTIFTDFQELSQISKGCLRLSYPISGNRRVELAETSAAQRRSANQRIRESIYNPTNQIKMAAMCDAIVFMLMLMMIKSIDTRKCYFCYTVSTLIPVSP